MSVSVCLHSRMSLTNDFSLLTNAGYDQRVEFFGKEGTVMHDNLYPNNVHLWNGKSTGRIDLVRPLGVCV